MIYDLIDLPGNWGMVQPLFYTFTQVQFLNSAASLENINSKARLAHDP
jgi:hypothetical protein